MNRSKISGKFAALMLLGAIFFITSSCTIIELAMQGSGPASEEGETSEAPEVVEGTTNEVNTDFEAMKRRVERMSRQRISNMSDREVYTVAGPILSATLHTIRLSEATAQSLVEPLNTLTRSPRAMSPGSVARAGRQIEQTISSGDEGYAPREWSAEDLRGVLLSLNQRDAVAACGDLFNMVNGNVLLAPGDHFNIANNVCEGGSVFVLLPGVHAGQFVESSKRGNVWIGAGTAIMDGENEIARAYSGGLAANTISNIIIRNYTDHGIHSMNTSDVHINHSRFQNIAPEKHGQGHGGIMVVYGENLEVRGNHFENVASGVRFVNGSGPLSVVENTAFNSGRNFFQCDKCNGGGIRVNRNSMEQQEQYGIVALEDWINIYMSNGERDDPIQVNYNRAKGYGDSDSGSFIMLGDATGSNQEAVGNIGVNPGQVGIGIASGVNIRVEGNKMYSEQWEHSNVAYYSAEYSSPCGAHQFMPGTNTAHWRNSRGQLNRSWTDGNCGLTIADIRSAVEEDRSITPGIWSEW